MRGCADYLRGRSWLAGAGSFMSVAGADLMCLECKRVVRGRLLGAGGTVRQRKQASKHRKDVPCGRYDLTGPGLYSQRELTFVLFFARVLL